eukprot:CAMPEP_0185723832 /NCGR_PEP_ID=MMETSP1171-20130828/538_1 /TAXON_ID=374046 /ORGANISM="Helicotheca tamensis, Strain CCMP826" /LENGTH=359 /DNA_ID=CAMNT_0028391587 /DNA_START=64 /DNA_END=1143 /DNA_ORIENTATION=+
MRGARHSFLLLAVQTFLLAHFTPQILPLASGQLDEGERVREYHRRGHTWPPREEDFVPNTPGWRKIMERRLEQLVSIENGGDKYNGYMFGVHTALVCKNFTENGWALTRAPQKLVDDLVANLHRGLQSEPPLEADGRVACIETENRPLFVENQDLNQRALRELQPILEAWSGVKLVGNNAYGLRVYRNESSLNMHVDKTETHIISTILHVDHDLHSEPWPIVIEDYQGNTQEVVLESGDMLLYESSKCMHGRPKNFNGDWYSSVFVHYYPVDWDADDIVMSNHYRIPPTWRDFEQRKEGLEELLVVDTSAKEPECEHEWCAMKDTKKWAGPSKEFGMYVTTDGVWRRFEGLEDHYPDEL